MAHSSKGSPVPAFAASLFLFALGFAAAQSYDTFLLLLAALDLVIARLIEAVPLALKIPSIAGALLVLIGMAALSTLWYAARKAPSLAPALAGVLMLMAGIGAGLLARDLGFKIFMV